ncbi:MAG: hypothetical protein KZQ94_05795 [Candidatus Thiodiazotropha sp. (ex Troendleina suluensis)]|nr:hypothetical protein [Candidatus Thiodiazotropha sp. (ex Troendleina suluensis)]
MNTPSSPLHLLFRARIGKDGKPLFANRMDLVRVLIASDYPTRSEASFSAYLSQVLKPGGSKYSRPFSEKIRSSILAAAVPRLGTDISAEEFERHLDKSFELHKQMSVRPADKDLEWDILESTLEEAKTQFIVTHQPAELMQNKAAADLTSSLISALDLTNSITNDITHKCDYVFVVNSKAVASQLWLALFLHVKRTDPSLQDTIIKGNLIKQNKDKHIRTFVADNSFCKIPFVLVNVGITELDEHGYIVIYKDVDNYGVSEVSLAIMNRETIRLNIEESYNVVMNQGMYEEYLPEKYLEMSI